MPKPTGLGHVGIFVKDLDLMKDFYSRVVGLTVTDENLERGFVFLSARPHEEHHEFLLKSGRRTSLDEPVVEQLSFVVERLEDLQEYLQVFKREQVKIERIVTHGNAFGIYFRDPEGNRAEVYWHTNVDWPQPFSRPINIEQPAEDILKEGARILAESASPAATPA